MKQLWNQLTSLLAKELFNTNTSIEINDASLDSIIDLAQRHAVEPLLFNQIRDNFGTANPCFQQLRARALSFILRNEQINNIQDEVLLLLKENSIPCAILKGNSVALCYPHPELRALGDIDILVSPDMFQTACDLLSATGYMQMHGHDFHESFLKNGVCVELHHAVSRFPDTPLAQTASHLMEKALFAVSVERIAGHTFPVLQVQSQLISLLAHMERHMSSGGIGLRQLCDWAVTLHHYRNEITSETLSVLKNCGLLQFAKTLTKTCILHLGLPAVSWADSVPNKHAEMMFNEIMTAENISNISSERVLSVSMMRNSSATGHSPLMGSISSLNQKAIAEFPFARWFPPALPFIWAYFMIKRSLRIRQGKQQQANVRSALKHANTQKKLLNKLKIYH